MLDELLPDALLVASTSGFGEGPSRDVELFGVAAADETGLACRLHGAATTLSGFAAFEACLRILLTFCLLLGLPTMNVMLSLFLTPVLGIGTFQPFLKLLPVDAVDYHG